MRKEETMKRRCVPHCNGGFLDTMDLVNEKLKKMNKPLAIGFEKDKRHKGRLRFFDKNNNTVWLPDDFYKKINWELIKMGAMNVGRRESNKWRQIATGHYTDGHLWLSMKIKEKTQQLKNSIKKFLGLKRSR